MHVLQTLKKGKFTIIREKNQQIANQEAIRTKDKEDLTRTKSTQKKFLTCFLVVVPLLNHEEIPKIINIIKLETATITISKGSSREEKMRLLWD